MDGFLRELSKVFKNLPRRLLDPATLPPSPIVKSGPARYVGGRTHAKA
jgi:hypothetical protein